jgi:hypothetical protein
MASISQPKKSLRHLDNNDYPRQRTLSKVTRVCLYFVLDYLMKILIIPEYVLMLSPNLNN